MYPAFSPDMIELQLPFHECVRLAEQAGFKGLGINPGAIDDPQAIRQELAAAGLAPAAWNLPVEFREGDNTFREGLGRLPEVASKARQIGATRCCTWIMPLSDDLPFEDNFDLHRIRLQACAEVLAENECHLGLEFVGPKTLRDGHVYEFVHTQSGVLALCEAIDTGNVGLALDSFHWHTSRGTKDDINELSDALIVDVHVNDAVAGRGPDEQIDEERHLPGESGVIDIVTFLRGLKRIGYTGPVTPEPFGRELRHFPAKDAVRATAQAMQRVWKAADIQS